MKLNFYIFFALLMGPAFMSCSTALKTATGKSTDIHIGGVIQKPIIADLDVKPDKVSGTAERNNSISIELVKQEAVLDALRNSNSDILIEPIFETNTIGKRISASVSGFPATYKNFRPIKQEDLSLINTGIQQQVKVYTPQMTVKNRKNNAWAIIGGALGLGALIGISIGSIIAQ